MTVVFAVCLVVLLVGVSAVDLGSWRIPNTLNAALGGLGLLWAGWAGTLLTGVLGGAVGLAVPLLIRSAYFKLRGRQGLGLGDVKFLGAAGIWVGWDGLPILLLIASISGLTMVVVQRVTGGDAGSGNRVAFGPHLSLGLLVVWIAKAFELG